MSSGANHSENVWSWLLSIDFSLTVKAATSISYLVVVRLFHLLKKGNKVLSMIW